jgi:putative DNA primase/helicase
MTSDTVTRARGRWPEILSALGIGISFLKNKHGPCPLCGGKDRFRFDNKDRTGSYFCNQCGSGSGIVMLRKLHDWDHKKLVMR